jgi:hypothetical protein
MSETKTRPTGASVAAFLSAIEAEAKRKDAETICAMMQRVEGEPPELWGPTMVGFGHYRYRYESGHSGESFRVGFSPRKGSLVLYIVDGLDPHAALLARLGKFKAGKSCLYINKLADVDVAVLEALVTQSVAHMDQKYPR